MGNFVKTQKSKHGYYTPKNPEKYHGSLPIRIMSSWEESFARWCDHNPGIVSWSSESVEIKYQDPINPIDSRGRPKIRRYYPDFLILTENGEYYLIEIKPYKETVLPSKSSRKSRKTVVTEERTYLINRAKWKAAENLCRNKGWKFKTITEKELFGK